MSRVAVTGISGYIAQRLLEHLESDDSIERIVGIDCVEPKSKSKKLEFHLMDIRDPELPQVLKGSDTVVHLAFVLNPMQDEQLMRDINVNGSKNVFDSAAEAGVKKIVYTSSIVAYGARPDNPEFLTEESPLRANPDFNYAEHKLEVELFIQRWRKDHPDIKVVVLRPAIVFGPHVQNFISRTLEAPRVLAVSGYKPPFQFVHEEDAAAAIYFAVERDLDGAYNVCPDDYLEWDEVLEIAGKKPLALPEGVMLPLAKIAWKLGLVEAPAGEVAYLMYPAIMSNKKIKEAGFEFRHSSRDALVETIEATRDWVTIGRWRMRREQYHARLRGFAAALGLLFAIYVARKIAR